MLPIVSIIATESVARSSVAPPSSMSTVSPEGKWSQVTNPSSARLGYSTYGASVTKQPITANGITNPGSMMSGLRRPSMTGSHEPTSEPMIPKNDGIATTCPERSSVNPNSCW